MTEINSIVMELPSDWLSADDMRVYALTCRNAEAIKLISNLMEKIEKKAEAGKMGGTSFLVKGGRSAGVYIQAQEILRTLGYKVEGGYDESPCDRNWTITW